MERQRLIRVIAEQLDIPEDSVTPNVGPGVIEEWDSLANIVIITAIEKEFGVKFSMQDIMDIRSVEDIELLLSRFVD